MKKLLPILIITLTSLLIAKEVWSLPNCPSAASVWNNCFGTFTWTSGEFRGDKYVGEWNDDQMHGWGTYYYLADNEFKGDKYKGYYENGLANGQGTYTFADGDIHVGNYKDGGKHGQGTYTFGSGEWKGDKYVGEFKNDNFDGQGTYIFRDGEVSEGIWKDNEFQYANVIPKNEPSSTSFEPGDTNTDGLSPIFKDKLVIKSSTNSFEGEIRSGGINVPVNTSFHINSSAQIEGSYSIRQDTQHTFRGELYGCKILGSQELICTWKDEAGVGKSKFKFSKNFNTFEGYWYNNTDASKKQHYWSGIRSQALLIPKDKKTTSDDDKVYSAASGSGFAVTSDGYVITNYHVIDGCTDVKIHDKGKSILATLVTFDPNNDIALLKGDFKPRSFYPLSRETPKLLMEIFVAGHPFGQDISTSVKVTKGIISSLSGVANNFSNLQIDAALQPGNSGGPIMNDKGNVIGVAVSKLDLEAIVDDYGVVPENVNFGVKANVVINILESENIKLPTPNINKIPTNELSELITDGTYYLSCWMTVAQIEKMLETKVMFKDLK